MNAKVCATQHDCCDDDEGDCCDDEGTFFLNFFGGRRQIMAKREEVF
jgi:hypothetical protein